MPKSRVVCLNCIDGRVQMPVIQWITDRYDLTRNVDMITEPGMDGLMADPSYNIDALVEKIRTSICTNNAQKIFLVGHHDCRGNPVSGETHQQQIVLGMKRLAGKFPEMEVIGLWVNDQWDVTILPNN